jgi:CofH subfamily radical SAM domain protein
VSKEISTILRGAEQSPAGLSDLSYAALLDADEADLEAVRELADAVRQDAVGDYVTFVVNRNLDPALVGGPTADSELLRALIEEAVSLGVTEICMQGLLPAEGVPDCYLALIQAVAKLGPELHLHAFRPAEVLDAADRMGLPPREFLHAAKHAGLGSVPGTGARILDDDVRATLLGGADLPVVRWVEMIETAHEVGLSSTATMVYGHVETPAQQIAHLRTLIAIQDRTGGFTEFIAMPFHPPDFPAAAAKLTRIGPTLRETLALHAVARLMLHGRIDHVQAAWPKLGTKISQDLLRGGADDIGGLLLRGAVAPAAGAEATRELSLAQVQQLTSDIGRMARQRTTGYGTQAFLPCP